VSDIKQLVSFFYCTAFGDIGCNGIESQQATDNDNTDQAN